MSFKCLYYLQHQGTVRAVEEGVAHHAKQQGLRNVPQGRDLQIGLVRLTLLMKTWSNEIMNFGFSD